MDRRRGPADPAPVQSSPPSYPRHRFSVDTILLLAAIGTVLFVLFVLLLSMAVEVTALS